MLPKKMGTSLCTIIALYVLTNTFNSLKTEVVPLFDSNPRNGST